MGVHDNLGLIQVYTGNGKGKTTASLGLAFRALGHEFNVCMIQFMKKNDDYGEVKAARKLPNFKFIQVGREAFIDLKNPESIDYKLAEEGWELAKSVILSEQYSIVILDEINVAMAAKLLDASTVAAFLQEKKNSTEVVLTGRYAPDEITTIAHLVTEMHEIRHPFSLGVPARKGIDY
ncbi:MAG: cobO 2 [Sporomusa sp.]|nr:cobO 2 [Sporomusa sp.]